MRLNFFGDVYLENTTTPIIVDYNKNEPYVFNFEFAHYDKEDPHALNKALLKSDADLDKSFMKRPVAVDVNNNHIFDYGIEGFLSTVEYLKKNNVKYFGSGTVEENHNNPVIITVDGKKVALIGYYYLKRDREIGEIGKAYFNEEQFLKDVQLSKELGADLIIPSIHWGVEHSPGYTKKQQDAAHYMIDHGADLVIGHHPHCIQPIEEYKNKYIFYSLGNFAFNEIYTKSWYTDEKTSQCMHCKRWYGWSRRSLCASIDVHTGEVFVEEYYQKKNLVKRVSDDTTKLLKKYKDVKFIKPTTFIRKTILAITCFTFFKGHIFYWAGFKQVCQLFFEMHIKTKDMNYPE